VIISKKSKLYNNMEVYKRKKVKNPAISYWKQLEREKRKKTGKATKMEVIPRKIILSFN